MPERPLARGVAARHRFGRLMSLGDRNQPSAWTPGLVLDPRDPEMPLALAPFTSLREGNSLPAGITLSTRANLCYPFDTEDTWQAVEGLVLPPSLAEADSGEFGNGSQVLPVSWQAMHHDQSLNDTELEPSVVVLVDAPQLTKRPGMLVDALDALRVRFPSSLLWTPGIGGPDNCAMLVWMGADLFDLARSRHASSLGVLLSEDGPREVEETVSESADMDAQCAAWTRALAATRAAIRNGSLRELAERQSTSSARSVERLRRHDAKMRGYDGGRAGLARVVGSEHTLRCHTYTSRDDPLIHDWRNRVADQHEPPEHQRDALVLLPCSATKPYRISQSHKKFLRSLQSNGIHQVMVTAPLGLVPRELEEIWPAANYDIPVTGDWDSDEITVIRDMVTRLATRVGYSRIINHSGVAIEVEGIEVVNTRNSDSAGSQEALERLESEVNRAADDLKLPNPKTGHNRLAQLRALSRFQHGTDVWLEDASVLGRPPIFTIKKEGVQIAQWNPRTARFAFSKSCLPLLDSCNALPRVSLKIGVDWRGDLFSTNVESAEEGIRAGDEVLVMQDGGLVGSARAEAPGWEWPDGPGRLARAQHRL